MVSMAKMMMAMVECLDVVDDRDTFDIEDLNLFSGFENLKIVSMVAYVTWSAFEALVSSPNIEKVKILRIGYIFSQFTVTKDMVDGLKSKIVQKKAGSKVVELSVTYDFLFKTNRVVETVTTLVELFPALKLLGTLLLRKRGLDLIEGIINQAKKDGLEIETRDLSHELD